jgi:nocardicin N-oxygenase
MTSPPQSYPFDEPSRLDLNPAYREMRQTAPVARVHLPTGSGYLVTGYEEACRVLRDSSVFSREAAHDRHPSALRPESHLTDMDPPRHTRLRRSIAKQFTPRKVERWRPRAEQITRELLEAMAAAGPPADLIQGLALPLPVTVISELLGVDPADKDQFATWADRFLSHRAYTKQQVDEAHRAMSAYLADKFAQRRTRPRGDLISHLAGPGAVESGLTQDEMLGLAVGLLVAGFETTANQLGNFLYILLTHPTEQRRLREQPELLATAVEELLRFVPLGSEAGMPRVAMRDVTLGGVRIRTGETVLVARLAANRDERLLPDSEQMQLDRTRRLPHNLAFGYGTHHCLGAHLARMELTVAIGELLRRFGPLRLDVDERELRWKTGLAVRGLVQLPAAWEN